MTPPEDKGSKDNKAPKSYTELGVSSAIISLANLCLEDPTLKGAVTICAPFVGYGAAYALQWYKKKLNYEEFCQTIDNMIDELSEETKRRGISKGRKTEIETEIADLRKMKRDRTLKKLDIDFTNKQTP